MTDFFVFVLFFWFLALGFFYLFLDEHKLKSKVKDSFLSCALFSTTGIPFQGGEEVVNKEYFFVDGSVTVPCMLKSRL